jgi:putative ABC transport system permease protein
MFASLWSEFRYRLRALVRRDLVERDLDDELRFHLERHTEQLIRAGVPRHEAMRRSRLAFGGMNRIKDDTRDARGTTLLEHFVQDLRDCAGRRPLDEPAALSGVAEGPTRLHPW